MKFTQEEINLCKEIAKYHRREIKDGEWVVVTIGRLEVVELVIMRGSDGLYRIRTSTELNAIKDENELIPLWTLEDCLEFLEKKEYQVDINRVLNSWFVEIYKIGHKAKSIKTWKARLLESCQKAVLAVLREK